MSRRKRVLVILRRPPSHPRAAQGLRAAVGYVTADLEITVALCGPAAEIPSAAEHAPALSRPLRTLRALGHAVVVPTVAELQALLATADAVVPW